MNAPHFLMVPTFDAASDQIPSRRPLGRDHVEGAVRIVVDAWPKSALLPQEAPALNWVISGLPRSGLARHLRAGVGGYGV